MLLHSCASSLPEEVKQVYAELPETVDFNFHIRPILSDRCYKCHGPDDNTREAGLRLDLEDIAFAKLESRNKAIVSRSLKKSQAWQRIISTDPELQMPPPNSNLSLSANEKALIAKWIEQGAEWKEHWAFIPPERQFSKTQNSNLPSRMSGSKTGVYLNESVATIDDFIWRKQKEKGLTPSAPASKERLIRRLSFDLRGLPPSLEEIDIFLADDESDAYERLVDRFLETNAHAERMAMEWLDVARFADSHGLHADGMREMWPWRDWVIEAFKKNLSYQDFVTWQLAGDLLPEATHEQILATGFHRNHTANSESGIVSEEYRLKYVADRANTTATAFMGLTMECASCHDHKFDPISQKEYYEMTAFFNNIKELGMLGNDKNFGPLLLLPNEEEKEKLQALNQKINQLEEQIELNQSEVEAIGKFVNQTIPSKITPPKPDGFYPFDSVKKKKLKKEKTEQQLDANPNAILRGQPELVKGKIGQAIRLDDEYELAFLKGIGNFNLDESFSGGAWINTEKDQDFQTIMGNIGGKNTGWRGWLFYLDSLNRPALKIVHALPHNYLHVVANQSIEMNEWNQLFFTYDGSAKANGIQLFLNGQPLETTTHFNHLYKSLHPVKNRNYKPNPNQSIRLGIAGNYLFSDTDNVVYKGSIDQVRLYNQSLSTIEIAAIYKEDTDIEIASNKNKQLQHYLLRQDKKNQNLQQEIGQVRTEKFLLLEPIQEVMVLQEMANPRSTYILDRGQYTAPTVEVTANTPSKVLAYPDHLPKNRLGLANWLFDESHPLTARVTVNRYWQMIFGRGIVETTHDFGTQGALPSHPDLLDWLAVQFMESGWNVRALLRMMLLSATYQQSSVATEEHMSKDANNIYLAHAPTYRLQAEMIRDNGLAISNLINPKVGGKSVKPYQPEGLWKDKNEFSGYLNNYIPDTIDGLYRRSMYTFIRRTSPPPSMMAFDATDRAFCVVKREKTSTPLQSLILMNDPQFVEAARVLAERMQKEGGSTWEDKTNFAFRLACGRKPNSKELKLLQFQYDQAFAKFKNDPKSALQLLQVGLHPFDESLNKIETAAFAMVANTMMNFDEFYMKR